MKYNLFSVSVYNVFPTTNQPLKSITAFSLKQKQFLMTIKITLLFALCCTITKFPFAQTRHALIIAIGNYPDPSSNRWPVISSLNDVPLIKNTLVISQRFSEKNIRVLIDSQATKAGIVNALDELVATVKKGDIVVIHFSSHGGQLEDDNSDEIDQLDETIVPYGAAFSRDPEKFSRLSAGYLRDDLVGDYVTRIRNKLGAKGDLLVIIDACHSGSGTRGVQTAKIRGGNIPMVSNKFQANKIAGQQQAGVFKEENTTTKLNADAATYVVVSGAMAQESNYECNDDNGNPVGSLSYAFSKSVSSLKGNITYRGLFALIENVMSDKAPNQKPVLEGDGIDKLLFGGRYEKQLPYFTISSTGNKTKQVVLNGGFIAGITNGSEMNFFEPGTTSMAGKTPLGRGKVINSEPFSSTVMLDSMNDKLPALKPWAFINELSYGAEKLKLFVTDAKGIEKMVEDSLRNFKMVEFDKACDLVLDTFGTVSNWALKYPNTGHIFQSGFVFSRTQPMEPLKEALRRFGRFRYLKSLSFNEDGLSAKVEVVFLGAKGNIDDEKLNSRTHLGLLELKENDEVFLKITNTGYKQFYINIVDIQPDGFINPVLPNKNVKDRNNNPSPVKWEDCLVKGYDSLFLRNLPISIQKPYGEETFKVFLSSAPLDLEDILTTKVETPAPANKRGVLNGLEKIFINSNISEKGERGVIGTNINTDQNGTVFSINFKIVQKL